MRTHQQIDRRSLAMARAIVARGGLDRAKETCRRWVEMGNLPAREWLPLLEKPWAEIRAILLDESEEGQRLRQNDPFCRVRARMGDRRQPGDPGRASRRPAEVLVSQDVALYAPGDERASDLIDGSIGEKSPFHDTFGYYAHGVGAETAVLPRNWRTRAIEVSSERSSTRRSPPGLAPA